MVAAAGREIELKVAEDWTVLKKEIGR